MNKKKKRLPAFPLAVFVLVFLGLWWVYGLITGGETTAVAVSGVVEDMFTADGIVIRNEAVVTSDTGGVLQSAVKDGDKVAKGQRLGALLVGNTDPALQTRLENINARIEEVKANGKNPIAASDIAAIDERLSSLTADVTAKAVSGDQTAINRIRMEMDGLIEKKSMITGESGPAASVLDRLNAEKQQLESQMGQSKTDIYAPSSGVFSLACDGYEKVLTPERLTELTPSGIDTVLKAKPEKQKAAPYPVCKIVDNGEWVLALSVPLKSVEGLKTGDYIALRFPSDPSVYLDASVAAISEPKDDKTVLCIASSQSTEGIYGRRSMSVDVIKHRYRGLKIPKSALTTQNGKDGVMVRRPAGLQFKQGEVIYRGTEYAIIKENNQTENYLLLYDEVVSKKGG